MQLNETKTIRMYITNTYTHIRKIIYLHTLHTIHILVLHGAHSYVPFVIAGTHLQQFPIQILITIVCPVQYNYVHIT